MSKTRSLLAILLFLLCSSTVLAGGNRDFEITLSGTPATPRILACKAPEFSFHLPQMAGNFRIGIVRGEKSSWGSDLRRVSVKNNKGKLTYTLKDPLLGDGTITVRATKLTDSDGIIVEVQPENVPADVQLVWSFGGSYGKVLDDKTDSKLKPEYCKYNVFSVERTSFTVYYSESMKLKLFMGVTPLESDIRLSDAHQQQSPLTLFQSGKETDAPTLSATCPIKESEKLYFCFYTQNKKADYNYYMLPALFNREFEDK